MAGEAERVSDIEKEGDSGVVRRWFLELKSADDEEKDFRLAGVKVEDRYRDDERTTGSKFNILWSNTQVLHSAIFSGEPKADVRRRFRDKDEEAKNAAIVLERGIEFAKENHDFKKVIDDSVDDYLLPGRGQARVRYITQMGRGEETREALDPGQTFTLDSDAPRRFTTPAGEDFEDVDDMVQEDDDGYFRMRPGEEEVVHEEVIAEYVPWDDYRQSPAKRWEDVRWVAFRTYMTRDELEEQFGSIGGEVLLVGDWEGDAEKMSLDTAALTEVDGVVQRALVWEIWDRDSGEMIVVSPGLQDKPIHKGPAPLSLKEFFPCPRPMVAVKSNRTQVPIPEFTLYQDQADELDKITARIDTLIDAIQVRGVYDARFKDQLDGLFKISNTRMLPVENFQNLLEQGGLDGTILWLPIEQFANALQVMFVRRAELIQAIYDITGISDIQRGSTDPRETLGAQHLKAQFGTLRLKPRQEEVQRFIRDLFRLFAEVIGEEFSPETLIRMAGTDVVGEEDMPGVLGIIRDDGERGFRVDVETDSTVAADDSQTKQDVTEFLAALGSFFAQAFPLAQTGALTGEAIGKLVAFAARRFKVSRDVEETLDQIGQPPEQSEAQGSPVPGAEGQGGPQGQAGENAPQAASEAQKLALAGDAQQIDATYRQKELELKEQELELKARALDLEQFKVETNSRLKTLEIQIKAAAATGRQAA